MEKKLKTWRILGIVFMSLTGLFFLTTLIFATSYSWSNQSNSKLSKKVTAQENSIKKYRQTIKDYKEDQANSLSDFYNDFYDDYGYDDDDYDYGNYEIEQTAELDDGVEMTITELKEDASLDLEDVPSGHKKVVMTVRLKNGSDQVIEVSPEDFYLYDSSYDLGRLNDYDDEEGIPATIDIDQEVSFKVYFTIPQSAPYLVNYDDAYWYSLGSEEGNSI